MDDRLTPENARTAPTKSHYGLHAARIAPFIAAGWRTDAWKRVVCARLRQRPWCGDDGYDASEVIPCVREAHLIPDAYRLVIEPAGEWWCQATLILEMLEVEVTHGLTQRKAQRYFDLWWAFDAADRIHLRLFTVNRFGHVARVLDTDPSQMYAVCGNYLTIGQAGAAVGSCPQRAQR